MNIEQKFILSQKPLCFFTEGAFLRLYNESVYVAHHYFHYPITPSVKYIKKINQTIITAGFPAHILQQKFPQSQKTSYGYCCRRRFDLSGYQKWYETICKTAEQVSGFNQ